MKIASLHFGNGGGHLFGGLAIWQAFRRCIPDNLSFYLLTNSEFPIPVEDPTLDILRLHLEPGKFFARDRDTMLYQYLEHLDPDVIIVDHIWLPVMPILESFKGKKIIYFRQIQPQWLQTPELPDGSVKAFNPESYDLVFNIEPGFDLNHAVKVPPLIGVSSEDVKSPEVIRRVLNVPEGKKLALAAHNGHPGELEKILKETDINRDEYHLVSLSNLNDEADQLFPLSHYLSGVDLAIGGCGYNFFYETRFYDLTAIYLPQFRDMEDQHWRLETNRHYSGPFNGAEIMVQKILSLL